MSSRPNSDLLTKAQSVFDQLLFDLKWWNVPISESVCPKLGLIDRKDCYAETCFLKDGRFKVSVSTLLWKEYGRKNLPEALRNVLAHELCHTIDGCFNHGAMWKYWVKWLNAERGFKINPFPYSAKETELY